MEPTDEAASLLGKQRPRRWKTPLALGVAGTLAVAWTQQRTRTTPQLQETTAWDPSSICLVHAAYGDYVALSQERTLPLKRAYAEKHGYRVVARLEDSLEDLAAACPDAYSTTADDGFEYTMASAKYCSLEVARRSGCEWAFWTDADAVFVATDAALDRWLPADGGAFAVWSTPTYVGGFCGPEALAGGCTDAGFLGSCVNLGAFLLRVGSDEGRTFLRAMLDLSMPDIVASGFDSTYTLAGGHTIGDQCKGIHESTQDNDQCGLAYLLQKRPELFDGSLCAGAHGESAWPVPNDCGDGDGAVDLQLLDTTLAASSCPLVVNCVRGLDPDADKGVAIDAVLASYGIAAPASPAAVSDAAADAADPAAASLPDAAASLPAAALARLAQACDDFAGYDFEACAGAELSLGDDPGKFGADAATYGAAATGGACAAAGAEGWYVPCKWQMIAQMDAVCAGTFEAVPPAATRGEPRTTQCQVHAFCDACRDDAGALAASCASYLAMNPQILDDGRDDWADRDASAGASTRAAKGCEIPNFKGSSLGRFPLVLADFWTSDHLSERSRSVDAFSGTRARETLTLKRR